MTRHSGMARVEPDRGEAEAPRPRVNDPDPTPRETLAKLIAERQKVELELRQLQGTELSADELQRKKSRALSRDEGELGKISADKERAQLELEQLRASALQVDELRERKERTLTREQAELDKLSAEKEKGKLELQQLQGKALNAAELQKQKKDEATKRELELEKLRRESFNARWSPAFESLKVVVSTGAIAGSILVSAMTIAGQDRRERTTEISQQLSNFNDKMLDKDSSKQVNAIAAVRSLRVHAIPSLIANLDSIYGPATNAMLKSAILRLHDDAELRPAVRKELLTSIKYVVLRELDEKKPQVNLPSLNRHIAVWRECLRQSGDRTENLAAVLQAGQLALELENEIKSKVTEVDDREKYVAAVRQLLAATGKGLDAPRKEEKKR